MRPAALTSLTAAETELRELRSAGAVFGLLDVDDEFFVIVRPAPAGTRLLLSDATAALDYDIAAEALEKLDADISPEDLDVMVTRLRRATWDFCRISACPRRCWASSSRSWTSTPTSRSVALHARWASPRNCRPCSTVSIGDRRRPHPRRARCRRQRLDPATYRSARSSSLPTGPSWRGRRTRARHSAIRQRTREILAMRAAAAVLGEAGDSRASRWR